MLLSGCADKTNNDSSAVNTQGALSALRSVVTISNRSAEFYRPGAPLGLYMSLYLAQNSFGRVLAARTGIEAQIALSKKVNPATTDVTYQLLEEFGAILQVDIPDTLNRSDDRPTVLNEYLNGLKNITARSQKKAQDLKTTDDELRDTLREKRSAVNTMERDIRKATDAGDYQTAGSKRQDLSKAQLELAQLESEEEQTRDLLSVFTDLLEVSAERIAAIESNREVLLAGLKVVDVPGIEDLDILLEEKTRRRSNNVIMGL
jgi:hypothetical protein